MATKRMAKTAKAKTKAEASGSAIAVHIPPPDIRHLKIKIRGMSPLIVNRFSEKAKRQIEDKQQQKAVKGRGKREPEAEYKASLYTFGSKYGFPASGFKKAMITASAQVIEKKKMFLRGCFFVKGTLHGETFVEIKGKPSMREDFVRLQGMGRPADIRYRAQFEDWTADLNIQYNAAVVSPEQLLNLLQVAGFSVGIGDWRPERDGHSGMFEVAKAA